MLVVLVLGIVAAVALPPVGRAMIAASVQNARHVVISTISLARASAMRYGRPVVLHLDSGGERVWVEADTTLSGTGTAIDTIGLFYLEADLDVDLEANRSALCFDARGAPPAPTARSRAPGSSCRGMIAPTPSA